MKKKISIFIGIIIILLIIVGVITNYADSGRVTTGNEPKYCIKIVDSDGSKVTYWGIGYKVIRYTKTSPNEPYENNNGVKIGSWFMKYEMPKSKNIKIENGGQTIIIDDMTDIGTIENILVNSKYNSEICDGISTHKITINDDVYYIKESCKEIQKGDKQATISIEDLKLINDIISNKINNENKKEEHYFYGKIVETTNTHIIVEPNEGEEIRKTADKISIGIEKNSDMLYMVETNVKVTYDGTIMESYPAQIKATQIEVKSAEKEDEIAY